NVKVSSERTVIVPPNRQPYLAEIAETVRGYRRTVEEQCRIARERQQLAEARRMLEAEGKSAAGLDELISERESKLDPRARKLLENWPSLREAYLGDEMAGDG